MKVELSSVVVDDQAKAPDFCTEVLGFAKRTGVSVGEFSWFTVVSPEGHDDVELLLEPNANPAAKTCRKALGVAFHGEPVPAGPAVVAVFEDTCGSLIRIYQG